MKVPEFVKGFSMSKDEDMIEDVVVPVNSNTAKLKHAGANPENSGTSSYIAKDVVIKGSVESASDMIIAGRILDNVISKGSIKLFGSIEGEIVEAKSLELQGAFLQGNISVSEVLIVSKGSKIVGSVSARNVEVGGIVEGNISVNDNALIKCGANVLGNISGGSLVVERGATISGLVKVVNSQIEAEKRPIEPVL